jgi:hypothetical protein
MNNALNENTFIPDSLTHAQSVFETYTTLFPTPEYSPMEPLLKVWHCIAYLYPSLHPDEINNPNGGWPDDLLLVANEIWKRINNGEIKDEALYASDARWAGLCDQHDHNTPEELKRRQQLRASMAEEPLHAHILDLIDTKDAHGRISVFFAYRDESGPYEKWCGEWFETFTEAEDYKARWAQQIYDDKNAERKEVALRLICDSIKVHPEFDSTDMNVECHSAAFKIKHGRQADWDTEEAICDELWFDDIYLKLRALVKERTGK